ncbi:MAG: tail fiber domain-containing protein [Prosthecobacter sp.]
MKRLLLPFVILVSAFVIPASGQTPSLVSYQGRVAVGIVNFEGTGNFRFALVSPNGNNVYWSNSPDVSPANGIPDAAVNLNVTKGLYSVLLGDTSINNMAAIPASAWNHAEVRLRVWFNDGVNGSQQLTPDQRIAPAGYFADGSVDSPAIATGAITTTKIANNAVTAVQIAADAVTNAQMAAGAVTGPKIADGAVSTIKLNDGSVTSVKIANNAVTAAQIAADAVTNAQMAAGAVTGPKIADGAVSTIKLNDGSVTSVKIASNAVQNINIAAGAITSDKLGDKIVVTSTAGYGLGHKEGTREFSTYIDGRGVWVGSISNDPVQLYTNDSGSPNMTLATDRNVGIGAYEPIVSLAHPNSLLPDQKIYDGTTRGLHVDGGDKGIVAVEADNRAALHLRSYNASDDNREFVIRHDSTGTVTFAYPFGYGITEAPVMKMLPHEINMFQNNVGGCTLRVGDSGGGTASVVVRNTLSVDDGQQPPAGGYYGVNFGGSVSGEFISSNRTVGSTNRYGLDLYTASQPRLSIKSDGNVGIGTTTPTQARLVVSGNGGTTLPAGTYGYLTVGGAVGNASSNGVGLSIYAMEGVWSSGNFYASSDERIKHIIGVSDGVKDLASLMKIEITDYLYKDVVAKGDAPQKKVVAQQVEKIFPQAVRQETDVVPDIYQKAVCKEGWIWLKTSLTKGERVRLTDDKTTGLYDVLEVRGDRFRTSFQPDGGEVFVHGREVNDFRVVDYEAIAMLNVSATQALAKKLERAEAENAALRKRLSGLAAEAKAVESRLAALERALEHTAPVNVVLRR